MDSKTFTSTLAGRQACEPSEAARLIEGFAAVIREQCGCGNRVALPGFGTFEGVKRDEEITTDLATGCRMLLPPSVELIFTAGGMLKKKMKEGRK